MEISKLKQLKEETEKTAEEILINLFELENKQVINLGRNESSYTLYLRKIMLNDFLKLNSSTVKEHIKNCDKPIEVEVLPFKEFIIIRRKEKNV